MPKNCEQVLKKKIHVLEDKKNKSKATVRLENKAQIKFTVIDFDNCVMKNTKACDYVVTTDKRAIYVELKKSDVREGHRQIIHAADFYKNDHKNINKTGIISFTGKPKETSFIQSQKRSLMLKRKLEMICDRSPVTHKL